MLIEHYYNKDSIEEYMCKVGNIIEPLDSMRGFYLDRSINKLDSIGWDIAFNCLENSNFTPPY